MVRAWLLLILCCLLGLVLAGSGRAQLSPPRDTGLDQLKYKAIYGRPPPSPDSKPSTGNKTAPENEEEVKPKYRWGNDRLLNPNVGSAPGSTPGSVPAPAVSAPGASPGGSPAASPSLAPARNTLRAPGGAQSSNLSPGEGDAPPAPGRVELGGAPGSAPSDFGAGAVMRWVEVHVINDKGAPIAQARITVSSSEGNQPRSGYTDSLGYFSTQVLCYRKGVAGGMVHQVEASVGEGLASAVVMSNRKNCLEAAEVRLVLDAREQLRDQLQEYRHRQQLYQQDEDQLKKLEQQQGE